MKKFIWLILYFKIIILNKISTTSCMVCRILQFQSKRLKSNKRLRKVPVENPIGIFFEDKARQQQTCRQFDQVLVHAFYCTLIYSRSWKNGTPNTNRASEIRPRRSTKYMLCYLVGAIRANEFVNIKFACGELFGSRVHRLTR